MGREAEVAEDVAADRGHVADDFCAFHGYGRSPRVCRCAALDSASALTCRYQAWASRNFWFLGGGFSSRFKSCRDPARVSTMVDSGSAAGWVAFIALC